MSPLDPARRPSPAGRARATPSSIPTHATYVGEQLPFGRVVWVDHGHLRRLLPLRCGDYVTGYIWGRNGLGARNLSRSILCHALEDELLAERLCPNFTWDIVATLDPHGFALDRNDIVTWAAAHEPGVTTADTTATEPLLATMTIQPPGQQSSAGKR